MSNNSELEEQFFLARQPIYKPDLNVAAYELLFRSGQHEASGVGLDDDFATQQVVINTFTELGLNAVVSQHLAFINLTRQMLLMPLPIPHDRVVIELLENIGADEEVLSACDRLIENGFRLALDDFVWHDSMTPLLERCEFVKVDIREYSQKDLEKLVQKLEKYQVQLVAEKIETHEEFEFCKKIGFDFFQGYFLSKPNIMTGKKTSADKLTVTRLIAELRNPKNQINEIEKILANDPKLSFKLLQIINSAAFAKAKKIESLHQAIVYMGIEKLKAWASLIALTSVQSRSPELMLNAMIRAKMCELLATSAGDKQFSDKYFMVGLFSMLDAMLDEDLLTLIEQINLDADVKEALIDKQGKMGLILNDVLSYEAANWEELNIDKIESGAYRDAYFESINWAMETTRALS